MHNSRTNSGIFRAYEATRRKHAWPPLYLKETPHPERQLRRAWRTHGWTPTAALIWALVIAVLQTARPTYAQQPEDVSAGTLMFVTEQGRSEAPRVHTDVVMQISGVIARVEAAQQFTNPTGQWVEGVYAFPLPENSAVTQLHMNIGERVVVGEIREKAQAQQLYAQARANGQRASVVHQQRPNIFRTAVANIGPGEQIAIKITYVQIVDHQRGRYSLRFPLTITPRYLPGTSLADVLAAGPETPIAQMSVAGPASDPAHLADLQPDLMHADSARQSVSFDIDLDAGVEVDSVTSAYHPVDVVGEGRRRRIRLAHDVVVADRDFELTWIPLAGREPATVLFRELTGAGEHVLLMFMPPQTTRHIAMPRDVVFIIDTSGSMGGESIRQAQAALLHGLTTLDPTDRFNIIQFNSIHEALFDEPIEASVANLESARRYVRRLVSTGGTEMLPALSEAFGMPALPGHLRQIVFITDGAVGNEEQLMSVIKSQLGEARLFTVGIGSAPNGYFMRKAAQMGRGTFTFIGATNEVDQRMSELLSKLSQPVLTDIELQWPAGVAPEYAPEQIGDLYADEPIVLSARLKEPAKGMLSVTGQSQGAWRQTIALDRSESRAGVATLWARSKIEDLMDSRARGANEEAIRAEVLPLALQYQLVSKYTSLVAIDKTPVRPSGEPLNTTRLENTKPQGSTWQASGAPAAATNAELQLLIGLTCLLLAVAMRRTRVSAWR